MIHECNLRNYSIFLRGNLMFAYFEYVGSDFAGDMAKMAADPTTQAWWEVCMPMQQPIAERAPGEWWASLQEVFHTD
jgi:L-rhamnose mutarotase